MILDALAEFSQAQVLGPGATLSTYSIDLMKPVRVDGFDINIDVSAVSGTTPTLVVEVITATNGALTTGVVAIESQTLVIATGQAAKNYLVKIPVAARQQFLGLRYTMGGTTPACTVTASVLGKCGARQLDHQVA